MAFAFWPSLLAVITLTFAIGFAVWRWSLGPILPVRWRGALTEFIGIALKPARGVWMPPLPEYDEAADGEPDRSRTRAFVARKQQRDLMTLATGCGLRLAV